MRMVLHAMCAAALFGQAGEIRGTVVELGPLQGVEVTLTLSPGPNARVAGTTFTGKDGGFAFKPDAFGQFELDSQGARISGTVAGGGRAAMLLAKAPYDVPSLGEGNAPFSYLAYSRDGRFELTGIAPGVYRIASAVDAAQLPALIQTGETITIERGQQRTIELK